MAFRVALTGLYVLGSSMLSYPRTPPDGRSADDIALPAYRGKTLIRSQKFGFGNSQMPEEPVEEQGPISGTE
jgi:hypothetical protein